MESTHIKMFEILIGLVKLQIKSLNTLRNQNSEPTSSKNIVPNMEGQNQNVNRGKLPMINDISNVSFVMMTHMI
jgi:hypothetical protein